MCMLIDPEDLHMRWVVQWLLSSVKKVVIDFDQPLPKYATDLLLKNKSRLYIRTVSIIHNLYLFRFQRANSGIRKLIIYEIPIRIQKV